LLDLDAGIYLAYVNEASLRVGGGVGGGVDVSAMGSVNGFFLFPGGTYREYICDDMAGQLRGGCIRKVSDLIVCVKLEVYFHLDKKFTVTCCPRSAAELLPIPELRYLHLSTQHHDLIHARLHCAKLVNESMNPFQILPP